MNQKQGSDEHGKPGGKSVFCDTQKKTQKTQELLRKYFKFLEKSGSSVEIDFFDETTLLSCNNIF